MADVFISCHTESGLETVRQIAAALEAVGNAHTVGLRRDGTVVAVGKNNKGQCNVQDWSGIRLPEWVEI